MGTIKRERMAKQVEAEPSPKVWVDIGGINTLVDKSDLDAEGHLIEKDKGDGTDTDSTED